MRSLLLGWVLLGWGIGVGGVPTVAEARVAGVVFDDRNGDGVRDAGEAGLAGVGVSDGVAVVLTDAEGRYALPDEAAARTVFVIKPRDWRVATDAVGLPQFYRRPAEAADGSRDFALSVSPEPDAFRVLAFTDTQTNSMQEVRYLEKRMTALADSGGAEGFAFGVSMGDIVNDRFELFEPVNRALAKAGVPWWHVNGNHDRDPTPDEDEQARESRMTESFRAVYGVDNYAFRHGGALFVGLNNVRPLAGGGYVGGLREEQFVFLENLLRVTPPETQLVMMVHIPWFYPDPSNEPTFRSADRARLFALLRERTKVLWLSSHTHYQRHVFHGEADGWLGANPLHEYNVAAACGSFWTGPLGADGVPDSMMWDGTPPGYAELSFTAEGVTTRYRAFGRGVEHQVDVHVPAAKREGAPWVMFYANVFDGHDGWTVEASVDGRPWRKMRRTLAWDPAYAVRFLAQNTTGRPATTPRLPEPEICHHLWRAYLPADLPAGRRTVVIRATDPRGVVFTESAEIDVVAMEP